MRTETTTRNVYTFDELTPEARETARDWFREVYQHEQWWDCTFDDVRDAANMLGISIDQIYFSGFCSQGDGACITGSYSYEPGSLAAVRRNYGGTDDTALHDIAADLLTIQRPWFYGLSARITHHDRYSHEYSANVDVNSDDDITGYRCILEADEAITEALRDFMRWIYKRLEAEYDYLMSDESTDENIEANEYEFYADGSRA